MPTLIEAPTLPIAVERVVISGEQVLIKSLFAAVVIDRLLELPNMDPKDHLTTAITLMGLFLLHSWTCYQNRELNVNLTKREKESRL